MAEALKPPYLENAGEMGELHAWIVDGKYVREHIDEEFTNFGHHFSFDFIPLKELWLDREAHPDERRFFMAHLLVERRLMAKGVEYDKALEEADRAERKERRRAGDVRVLTHGGKQLPDGRDVHVKLWKRLENSVTVWVVNGRLVRSVFDVDFTEGGHDHVYEFVPENEIWIDDDLDDAERGFVLLHEMHERNRMIAGWPYSKAHDESSRIEHGCRQHPDRLHEALAAEGWE